MSFRRQLPTGEWTRGQLQAILHYPDQGDGEYSTDSAYGKNIRYRLLIYVNGVAVTLGQ